jgi:hypothetical protein
MARAQARLVAIEVEDGPAASIVADSHGTDRRARMVLHRVTSDVGPGGVPAPAGALPSTGLHLPPRYQQALELIAAGAVPVADLITHRLPLERTIEGIQTVIRGQAIKVTIEPTGEVGRSESG